MGSKINYKLDFLDLKIISLIDQNARDNISNIAKKIKTSQQVISYRLQNLENLGIIESYISCIDYAALGNTVYKIHIKLNATKEDIKKIINYLRSKNQTIKIIEIYSSFWDLMIKFSTNKLSDLYLFTTDIKKQFSEKIINIDHFIVYEKISFSRDYLTEKYRRLNNKVEYKYYDLKHEKINQFDEKILFEIKNNARISSVYLAKAINSTPNTVLTRLKQLGTSGIIKSYRPVIDFKKLPYSPYKLLLKINQERTKKEEELIKFLENNINIINILKLIGNWDLEIDFEVYSKDEIFNFINLLKANFFDIIKDTNLIDVSKEYYC